MMPREFTGKRMDLNRFIMSCMAHLTINKELYQTDEKKIGFMLSLLNEGEAGAWKEQFIQEAFNETVTSGAAEMTFGTFVDFMKRLKESFEPHNDTADALTQLRALKFKLGENINDISQNSECAWHEPSWTNLMILKQPSNFLRKPFLHNCCRRFMEEKPFWRCLPDGTRRLFFRSK